MKSSKLYIPLILALMVIGQNAFAQLQVTLILPPPSPSITNIIDNPNLFKAIVTNTTNQTVSFKTKGLLKLDGNQIGLLSKEKSQIYDVLPFGTNTYNLNDIFNLEADLEYDQSFIQTVLQTGYSPAGLYEWCFEMYDASTPDEPIVLPLVCKSQYITALQPPTILYPNNGISISKNTLPIMRWTPIAFANTTSPLRYELKVFKVLPGQDPMQAFRTNQPYFERSTMAVQLLWPLEIPMESGLYIWTVQAFNSDNVAIGDPEKFAEPQTFTIQKGNSITTSSELPLTAGAAILMQFSPKDDPNEIAYEMIINSKDIAGIQNIFDISDQKTAYHLTLKPQLTITPNSENLGFPLYNACGDVVLIYTKEGTVLTFNTLSKNNDDIGRNGTLSNQKSQGQSTNLTLPSTQLLNAK